MLVLCLSEPYLLLALIPLAVLYSYLQTYYRNTAREVRRLNSIARSVVTSHQPVLLQLEVSMLMHVG